MYSMTHFSVLHIVVVGGYRGLVEAAHVENSLLKKKKRTYGRVYSLREKRGVKNWMSEKIKKQLQTE